MVVQLLFCSGLGGVGNAFVDLDVTLYTMFCCCCCFTVTLC